ncbi:MAG TPA: hypothetical protein VL400_09685 [Polyangiaceae bacterium]|nr:hypothetical protein [Polyangiaceae bacterium]
MRRAVPSMVAVGVVVATLVAAGDAAARPGSGAAFSGSAPRQGSGTRSSTASPPRSRSWWSRVEVPNDTWSAAPSYSMPRDDASKRTKFDPEYPASWGAQATGPRGSASAFFLWIVVGLAALVGGVAIAKWSARRKLKAWTVRGGERAVSARESAAFEGERPAS